MTALNTNSTAALREVACDHCGLPVPAGLIDPATAQQFCCQGCRTVYQVVHSSGLEDYYRVRSAVEAPQQAVHVGAQRYDALDDPAFLAKHCQTLAGGQMAVDLRLEGVHCAACMWLVERLPRVAPGVISARMQLRDAVVRVTWDPTQTSLTAVAKALDSIGYPAHPARLTSAAHVNRKSEREQLIRLGVAGACAGNAMLLAVALYAGEFAGIETEFANLFRWLSAAIGMVSLAWPGAVFFRGAWSALRVGAATLDMPIALALATGGIAGLVNVATGIGEIYFDSLSVLVFLLLVGRWLQARRQRWADEAVGLLNSFTPATCRVICNEVVLEATTESLQPGDLVEVLSGDIVPADCVVIDGVSAVDRSLLTGESQPEPTEPDDELFAGTQNIEGTLLARVTSVGQQTRVGRLMDLVQEGVRQKPPLVQFTDRAAGWFVVAVVAVALATFTIWTWSTSLGLAVEHTVALLIVACPCALGLATPLTMAVSIGLAAQRQVLIKDAAVLETLAGTGRVLLDKTGTLTCGRPKLVAWHGPRWLQPVIAHAESRSTHPVAKAVVEAFGKQSINDPADVPRNISQQHGGGIHATVNNQSLLVGSPRFLSDQLVQMTRDLSSRIVQYEYQGLTTIGVALDGQLEAIVALGDAIHSDSRRAIKELGELGWHVEILSGDAAGVVAHVAEQLGVEPSSAQGGITPEDKLIAVSGARQQQAVVMIGDGVNDAAALAAANVGIAVEGGAEAALAAADVYVAAPGLLPIVQLMKLAKRTKRTVRRNLVIALAYNVLAVSLAACGYITPLLAAILMPISSATVLASAMSITLDTTRQ